MAATSVPDLGASFVHVEDDDFDQLTTVVASKKQTPCWIDPKRLKLRHRIGRGAFGDVWLATHHRVADDYDEYHEVALKMLHPIKEDSIKDVLDKLFDLVLKCQNVEGVGWLQGISVISGKICLIMKFYEGSVGDKMARLKTGKLSLPDALRYGVDLAKGVLELHSKGILVLNLKPSNFLLSRNDQAVLGDSGVPYQLLGVPLPSSDIARRLGTPNYMAPEQWKPEVRGPISFETDSWGFGCSIIEMVTGVQPWRGRSVDEIYNSVVLKHETPPVPSGLPPAIENVLCGCFEYDFRSRPLMTDILHVFQSWQEAVTLSEALAGVGRSTMSNTGYTKWFLAKDQLQVGDTVRSRKPPNSFKPENMDIPEGTVVGMEHSVDQGDFALVRVQRIHSPLRIHVSTLERITHGLTAGDWVRHKVENKKQSPIGIIHSIERDGTVAAGFIGLETLWKGRHSELQMAESYHVGQFIRLKVNVLSPRFEWPHKNNGAWATGRISWICPNGCLVVKFPGKLTFGQDNSSYFADPAEVEVVNFKTCNGMVKKYQHLEDLHWAVRPVLIALGLFTTMKIGFWVGKKPGKSELKSQAAVVGQNKVEQKASQQNDSQASSNPSLLNIIFGDKR